MEIPSPCIDICTLDDRNVCVGCGRHIDEIAAWGAAAADTKLLIVAAARERLEQMHRKAQQKARSA
jgi:uncharacterized protein